jgi:hypothetical protein
MKLDLERRLIASEILLYDTAWQYRNNERCKGYPTEWTDATDKDLEKLTNPCWDIRHKSDEKSP